MLALLAATTLIAAAGLVELWHAYDQAVLAATKAQGARYNGIGQNPNQIPMLIALTLPFAIWLFREARGRLRGLRSPSRCCSSARSSRRARAARWPRPSPGAPSTCVATVPHRWKSILAAGTALFVVASAGDAAPAAGVEEP